jgi:hypothetical protein
VNQVDCPTVTSSFAPPVTSKAPRIAAKTIDVWVLWDHVSDAAFRAHSNAYIRRRGSRASSECMQKRSAKKICVGVRVIGRVVFAPDATTPPSRAWPDRGDAVLGGLGRRVR